MNQPLSTTKGDCSCRWYYITLGAIIVVAVLLRAVGIGTWSFASDELGTFFEVRSFTSDDPEINNHPDANVPRMIPVGMLIHHAGHQLFGRDEAGSRAMMALCGIIQIAILGLGLPSIIGRVNSLVVCALITLTPEHLFYCQYHRFYAPAALFVTAGLLVGWQAMQRQSMRWFGVSLACTWLAVLTQTLTGSVVGSLLLVTLVYRPASWSLRAWRLTIVAVLNAVAMALFALLYLYPLGKGKAVGYMWVGDTVPQAVMSGVTQLSFPVALAMLPGLLMLWSRDRLACRYIAAFGLAWLGSVLVLPKAIPFHSAYLFPLNAPCFILAGVALGESITSLAHHRFITVVYSGFLLLLNLPSVMSYYQDGNRHDFRKAAELMVQLKQPHDRIAFVQGDKFEYYQPTLKGQWERLPPTNYQAWVKERKPADGRLWIVVPGGRSGVPNPWQSWLEKEARLRTTVKHRRFDYHDYIIFFYTLEAD